MVTKNHLVVAGLAGLLIGFAAEAQTHGPTPSVRMPPAHGGSSGMSSIAPPNTVSNTASQAIRPISRSARVTFVSPNGRIATGFPPTGNFGDFESDDVPGLGFDYVHLAAIGGALRNGRFDHHDHLGGGFFAPILFGGYGGYPFYYDDSGYEQPVQPAQPQPQIIVIQQPGPAQPPADSGSEAARPATATSAPQTSEPIRDVGEFILVRRDGRILFASMFSVVGEHVRYVTPEGMRRTIPVADLDPDATEQMNEARGTTVQIHN